MKLPLIKFFMINLIFFLFEASQFYDIFVNRRGKTNNSFMITNKIIDYYNINQSLLFKNNKLIKLYINKSYETNLVCTKKPKQVKITGTWINNNLENNYLKNNNNILGNNGIYIINSTKKIYIPTESSNYISYYNAKLLKNGDYFNLNNIKVLALFEINIGKNYVNNYLLQEKYGQGFYIEYHNLPHYHQPMNNNSSGFIILGEIIKNNLFLTAFKIPFKYSLFIAPNVLHSDSYLIGEYNVIYGKTNEYSTVIFKNNNLKIKKVYIKSI